MTFLEFIQDVEAYIRLEDNTKIRPVLKTLINDSILEFCRFWEWLYTVKVFEFTTGKSFAISAAVASATTYAITAADTSAETFTIASDFTDRFVSGVTFTVSGSTGNDGSWTVSSSTLSGGNTVITVTGDVTDATADGDINIDDDSLQIAGDQVFRFKTGDTVTIDGSTANDGDYTVSSTPTYANSVTTIVLTEALTDSTTDGTVSSEHEDYGIPDYFIGERSLYTAAGVNIEKRSYEEYLESSTGYWAMLGNRFYLPTEDVEYKLIYSWKDQTLTANSDESEVLDHYSDIIKQWTLVKFLVWYGDRESAQEEKQLLQLDLDILKRNEERIRKKGRPVRLSSHNRT